MARIRSVKPDFFTSDDVTCLSPLARLLYIGTWCEADREGRLVWAPKTLKRRYLPDDNCDIDALCRELVQRGLVVPYGDGLAYIPTFLEHQVINPRETASRLPEPSEATRAARVSDASLRVSDAPSLPSPSFGASSFSSERGLGRTGAPGSPLDYHRKHGPHVTGFCDWVCLPRTLVSELAGKAQQTDDEVIAWARGVREAWQGPVDEPDCFRFWRDRYRDDMRRPAVPAATRTNVTEHMATADYHAARQAARSVS